MRLILLFCCLWVNSQIYAQLEADPTLADYYSQQIDTAELWRHLTVLTSDSLEGRETGTIGLARASAYIQSQYETWNLKPASKQGRYTQDIELQKTRWKQIGLTVGQDSFRHMYDFIALPDLNRNQPIIRTDEVVYLGYGIDDNNYSDYKRTNVKGKVIMISAGEPIDQDGISHVTGSQERSKWSQGWTEKLNTAAAHGAELVLLIDPEIQKTIQNNRSKVLDNKTTSVKEKANIPNNCFISTTVARAIIGEKQDYFKKNAERIRRKGIGRPIRLKSDLTLQQHLLTQREYSQNVIALVEGSDLKDEWVVISAHYDHLGKRGNSIFHGADDNGSGTSTALELIRLFAKAKEEGYGPRRSVAIMLFAGEEKGLLGSKFYADHPLHPLSQTVADLNIDMVGRVDPKHEPNGNYIYLIGSDRLSTELHKISEDCNSTFTQLELDYTYNAQDDPNRFYYRSDHYNFAKHGIPIIFYFNGTHEDYHRPTDTIEKIDLQKMAKIGKLIFHTAWEVANRNQRLKVDVKDQTQYNR